MRHIFILARYWLGSSLRNSWEERASIAGWPEEYYPTTPAQYLAWIIDEGTIQAEKEEPDLQQRLVDTEYATILRGYAIELLLLGVQPTKLPWEMGFVLREDDIDQHQLGCECGNCSASGKSYGVGIYVVHPNWEQMSEEERSGWLGNQSCLERVYAPSEGAADQSARFVCQQRRWSVL